MAQDSVNDPLEDINIAESLKKSGDLPGQTAQETKSDSTPTIKIEKKEEPKEEPKVETKEEKKEEAKADNKKAGKDELDDLDLDETKSSSVNEVKMSAQEEADDLQSLKEDIGEVIFAKDKIKDEKEKSKTAAKAEAKSTFEVENEEKKLLDESKLLQQKISAREWDDISTKAKTEKYEVQKGDTLWKISQELFGSGYYYSKIWALNPQISNPHEIEPGTVLAFDTGDTESMPTVQVGSFEEEEQTAARIQLEAEASKGGSMTSNWLNERKKLIDQGVYFQYASEETYEDLERLEKASKNNEYEKYEPPYSNVLVKEPNDQYDETGFDKNSKIVFNFKEGFFLNTFVTTNVIQDVGEIKATPKESVFVNKYDVIYATFDRTAKVKPGDMFTVYTTNGEIKHPISDRSGFIYTTTAQIKTVKKIDDVWECTVVDQSGLVQRKDRITVYTPKLGKIARTYSKRNIEAAIIGSYNESTTGLANGDVVYLDRGRADGVELGNVFDVYSFIDRGTQRKITPSPTYRVGELNVINITDNFATALVTGATSEFSPGNIAFTRTQEEAARALKFKSKDKLAGAKKIEGKALEELDVELNLDDVSQDILNKADKIQLTEDELEELERQEREKSVIKDSERDVKELDRLEGEIKDAEKSLNEQKVDEDKYLEQSNLDEQEKKTKQTDSNAFESLDEIETDIGRKYLDEDLNNRENPYGLTEFDLEEIDELLNTGPKK